MARFDFSLIPEEKRPKPKVIPEEEREQKIQEIINELKRQKMTLCAVVSAGENDFKSSVTMIESVITVMEGNLKMKHLSKQYGSN